MPRRVTLPTADDLFRPTVVPDPVDDSAQETDTAPAPGPARDAARRAPSAKATGSGRVKHDEKMTVYVTSDELLDIEHARLTLRRAHGLGVDRGRLVRAAVAIALEDLEAHGDDSVLVRRLAEADPRGNGESGA